MVYDFKLQAFTLLEMMIVLVLLGVLASLAVPKIMTSKQDLCQEKLKKSLQLIHANLSQAQTRAFLLNDHTFIPELTALAQPFVFVQQECALQISQTALKLQLAQEQGMMILKKISGSYQFDCNGTLCSRIGY